MGHCVVVAGVIYNSCDLWLFELDKTYNICSTKNKGVAVAMSIIVLQSLVIQKQKQILKGSYDTVDDSEIQRSLAGFHG